MIFVTLGFAFIFPSQASPELGLSRLVHHPFEFINEQALFVPLPPIFEVFGSVTRFVPLSDSCLAYSAPVLKLCFSEPVLNLPVKAS